MIDVSEMGDEEIARLEDAIAERKEELNQRMGLEDMADLITGVMGDCTPSEYDHQEAGTHIGVEPVVGDASPQLITLRLATERGDVFYARITKA